MKTNVIKLKPGETVYFMYNEEIKRAKIVSIAKKIEEIDNRAYRIVLKIMAIDELKKKYKLNEETAFKNINSLISNLIQKYNIANNANEVCNLIV